MISVELVECIHQFLMDTGIAKERDGQMIWEGSKRTYDYDAPYWNIALNRFYTLGPNAGFPTEGFEYDYRLIEYQTWATYEGGRMADGKETQLDFRDPESFAILRRSLG